MVMDVTHLTGPYGVGEHAEDVTEVVHATLDTPIGKVPVRLFIRWDEWVLIAGRVGWGTMDWPLPGEKIAEGRFDDDDDYADVIRDTAVGAWERIKTAAEAFDVSYRMVYAEDISPGMVLIVDDDPPYEVTVLDVRARDSMVSAIVVDGDGDQRSAYFAPLQQARLRLDR